ncbi:MAG: hypothetical protein PHR28_00905 [candidate division Zixibacteria bacterium]|nr:hypothetical protein [candidate division Zixibacteria bacterium]
MRFKLWVLSAVMICGSLVLIFFGCSDESPITAKPDDGHESFWKIQIEKAGYAYLGGHKDIAITMTAGSEAMGSFDILVGYNEHALSFTSAELGASLTECGWEYFVYRYINRYGEGYPTSVIRLTGIAETDNGASHPDWSCIKNVKDDTLATLSFLTTTDWRWECSLQPIQFFWEECSDNTIGMPGGNSTAISQHVYDADGNQIQDYGFGLPGFYGAPDDSCLTMNMGQTTLFRSVDFVNGGVKIECFDVDDRGDLNLNGYPREIADAVMYAAYFVDGLSAFGEYPEGSIAASDVNADGIALTLEDLVYLIRIIVGDALPVVPAPDVTAEVTMKNGCVTVNSPVVIGAILMTFNVGNYVGEPALNVLGMTISSAVHNGESRVLVYDIGSSKIPAGTTDIVTVKGTATLTSATAVGYEGYPVDVYIDR